MRRCKKCNHEHPDSNKATFCHCGGIIEGLSMNISGTRDSFGIGKAFVDKEHGVIDNFKKWERAGYQDKPDMGNNEMNQMVKHFKKDARNKKPLNPKHTFL